MTRFEPIAVVGQACLLPGASSPAGLWRAVLGRQDLLTRATAATWEVPPERIMRTDADAGPAERVPSDRGGYVRDFDRLLEPAGYGLDAALVRQLDPLFQWLLHVGRDAVRDAGVRGDELARGGAIVGNLSYPTYAANHYAWSLWAAAAGWTGGSGGAPAPSAINRFMSGLPVTLLGRSLGLGRGGFTVDAACASSLYAIKYACDWLQSGRADLMLAGGVSRVHGLTIHAGFTTLQALSPTGRSRPLHADADGLVPSEGAAVVVLKRLADAQRDGNPILGVIRGIGLSNDGRGSGLLVPSSAGQVRAMTAAYRQSGLSPADIDLVECHATGTRVGDAAEIASCAEVFGRSRRIALGSLKSNLGHLLPVAGVAGLIKVMQSLAHGVHAPLRSLDRPNPALDGTGFTPTLEAVEWQTTQVRRAAVNAFGFGGNNAHLIVEQAPAAAKARAASTASAPRVADAGAIALVALAARTGNTATADDLARAAVDEAPPRPIVPLSEIPLPMEGSAFTPADLGEALPQQLLALSLAHEAVAQLRTPPRSGVAVYVGMGCDPEACRFGLNLRLADLVRESPTGTAPAASAAAIESTRQKILPGPVAASTLGLMPNVVANRINRQFLADAPSCAVSSEELSGLHALELGRSALLAGECDVALVGAVDLAHDPIHAAARRDAGRPGESADGGCMLVLKREGDARRDGDTILALLPVDPLPASEPAPVDWSPCLQRLDRAVGVAHAASGLLQVAAAAAALHAGRLDAAAVSIRVEALLGATGSLVLRRAEARASEAAVASPRPAAWPPADRKLIRFAAHRAAVAPLLHSLVFPRESLPPAPVLRPTHLTPGIRIAAPVVVGPEVMARPGQPVARPARALPAADASRAFTPPSTAETHAETDPAAGVDAAWQTSLAAAHELFLEEVGRTHAAFLHAMAQTAAPVEPRPPETEAPVLAQARTDVSPVGPTPSDHGSASRSGDTRQINLATTDSPPEPSRKTATTAAVAPALPGPKFTRAQLEQLASGRISDLFGPAFAGQDGFTRQVRMPMPPMLLADRVTGIDAVPGELGTGRIWTETDVTPDAWYLDVDRMPLGVTIEAGQADLLLVSWMGIDRHNRSERIYRLLGCEATVRGPLPKIGDTLQFEIGVDGHAELGPIRMMFFHSDLRVNGAVTLSVRNGQAGFFSDEELAESEGVLWDAATAAAPALRGTHGAPRVPLASQAFSVEAVRAFAEGRIADCFGSAFRRTRAHTRTPRIPAGRMQLIDEVTQFDPAGGPWRRGYLRTVKRITPDLWFFAGHFKNDPCMPGTLMLEGAVQSLAFYLTALGCTVQADGWRFEPVHGQTISMRCRGQCVPTSRELVYEVFVEEFNDGPVPRLRASVMASVDGLKAFLAEGLSLELVPDWPLEDMLRRGAVAASQDDKPAWSLDGFRFDHRSLLACALGRPSEAFGPTFRPLDSAIRIPRLPRPPYHFMSRIVDCTGRLGRPERGAAVTAEFEIDPNAWYFERNGAPTMPSCVFMEALLQPCGWLSSFLRDTTGQKDDIFFRNLDGTLRWTRELAPQAQTLRVHTELTSWSELGTMIIVAFRVRASVSDVTVATMETSFGFFPGDAFANQAGLAPTPLESEFIAAEGGAPRGLRDVPREGARSAAPVAPVAPLPGIARDPLLMLDAITGWWPQAGAAGLGIVRAEKHVDAGEWFFNAHFMQDPVQPGSLGIEALVQLLQCAVLLREEHAGRPTTGWTFEPVALAEPLTWKYRGQVVPENTRITSLVEIGDIVSEPDGAILARARGSLWVDGKKIYETPHLAMRARRPSGGPRIREFSLAATPWITDHRPSFTTAIVPLTGLLDELAQAAVSPAAGAKGDTPSKLLSVRSFFPSRWVACPDDAVTRVRATAEVGPDGRGEARLELWREARREALSRFDEVGRAGVTLGAEYPEPPATLPPLDAPRRESPYATGEMTHGPAFQVLRELRRSFAGASCLLDAGAGAVPVGVLHPALLDGCTHAVPFSCFREWYPEIAPHFNGLPRGVHELRIFGPTPAQGAVRCELRPRGLDPTTRLPLAYVQFIIGDRVWCDLLMEFALLDGTPFQHASYRERKAFIVDRSVARDDGRDVPTAVRFTRDAETGVTLTADEIARYQWMPRQLETIFGVEPTLPPRELVRAIATREGAALRLGIHPAHVEVRGEDAAADILPLHTVALDIDERDSGIRVRAHAPRLRPAGAAATFFGGDFLQDLIQATTTQHVRHFRLADPARARVVRGRPVIVCSNHQTALESLLFTDLFMRWSGCPLTTVTRVEHRDSWVGQVTDLLWRFPGQRIGVHPQMLFDRDEPGSFFALIQRFKQAQTDRPHALHLHVEGEQARRAAQPVARMTSAIIDLALETGLPILPVKFSGGLPRATVEEIVSLPVAYGRQDYTLGAPLFPDDLARLPRPRAAELVVNAINAVPPLAADEQPLAGPPARADAIRDLQARHGIGEIQAAILHALAGLPARAPITDAILDFKRGGDLPPGPDQDWHREFAQWLWRADAAWQAKLEAWKQTARTGVRTADPGTG